MKEYKLDNFLIEHYNIFNKQIKQRLIDFEKVPKNEYFYELCYCICTPQSKATYAMEVQNKLMENKFFINGVNPINILQNKSHYIRFHNQKSKRLLIIRENWNEISKILESNMNAKDKRIWLSKNINGIGMKESAHFMRNIGYKNLGILDRHILKHLVLCGVYNQIPNISSQKQYEEVEQAFYDFSQKVGISLDELDLLFWSYQAGEILK